jgi:CheY-like chemotaxis protein
VPILALTANAMDDAHQEAREAGVDGVLVKPVRLEQLARAIQAHSGA